MSQHYDHLIFIGRFQPFHDGHHFVITQALKHAKQVIILIGSANSPRTLKNPFTFEERQAMITQSFQDSRLVCLPIDDDLYNDHRWLANIQQAVATVTSPCDRVGIIGHTKDDSSYYLSLFPQWGFIELPNFDDLSATPMRKRYFAQKQIDERLPTASRQFLQTFIGSDDYAKLHREYAHIQAYQQSWQDAPYPPIFVTADALVVQAGHVLVVERGGDYGHGLWALAGGFLDKDETLLECAIRELYEETGLVIDKSALKARRTFDAVGRSLRGRTITTVFHFELTGDKLPDVSGSDDAVRAFWLPLSQLDGKRMFEDHHSIINAMLGL